MIRFFVLDFCTGVVIVTFMVIVLCRTSVHVDFSSSKVIEIVFTVYLHIWIFFKKVNCFNIVNNL